MARSILLVEDDIDIQECLKLFLEIEGHKIQTAFNGREALALLEQGANPDVILLDLMMPTMNGYEFLNHIKSIPSLSKIPIVLLSASTDIESTALTQVVRSVKKPIDLDVFSKVVEEACLASPALRHV